MNKYPDYINPDTLAKQAKKIKIDISVSELKKLHNIVTSRNDIIYAQIDFNIVKNIPTAKGYICGNLHFCCQRCLGDVAYNIEKIFKIAFFDKLEDNKIIKNYETTILENHKSSIKDLISDEILYALPMIIKHKEKCKIDYKISADFNTNNPFNILNKLKNNYGCTKK